MPSHLPADVRRRLSPIRLLVLDVDGVLTDGTLFYGEQGEVMKPFNVRDGLGIRLLLDAGMHVAVLTGRSSTAVAMRCRELGLRDDLVVQGSRDKAADLVALSAAAGVTTAETAAIGDDLPDLPVLTRVGFSACPADAAPEVVAEVDLVCGASGGRGSVREVAELILKAQGRWIELLRRWTPQTDGSATEDSE